MGLEVFGPSWITITKCADGRAHGEEVERHRLDGDEYRSKPQQQCRERSQHHDGDDGGQTIRDYGPRDTADRSHFYSLSAMMMRRILSDYARQSLALKRARCLPPPIDPPRHPPAVFRNLEAKPACITRHY